MQSYPQPQHAPDNDRHETGHRGPLSRTWPQIFKKRRRYSPVRESAQQQQQQQQQHHVPPRVQGQVPLVPHQHQPYPPPPLPLQPQPQQPHQNQQPLQLPIHPIRPSKLQPSVSAHSVTSPSTSSIRSPSLAADTASTKSTISHASSAPSKKVPIARRKSSIAPADSNGAGGVTTPQADLLASKSNYELISSGQHLEMGLHFSTAMATGVMMKRATHRAAEQARRDRMKTAMVDLAEFLLDGEVTFGSGTTCFVVMRGRDGGGEREGSGSGSAGGVGGAAGAEKAPAEAEADDDMAEAESEHTPRKASMSSTGAPGEKKTVNKARLIEMALEKMRAQEKEIEALRREIEELRGVAGADECMDES
ncbi:hypothetical protein J1614_000236 [Plenodomus biglobosus]|nr:hypothetical protein J1614_000236 [Plenodomus biglobosus]